MRLWYLRRGVPWRAVGACLAAAAVLAAAARHWPDTGPVLLPFAVAAGAAAAGFLLDDDAAAVVGASPRGGRWADASRLALLPVVGVVLLVLVQPVTRSAGLTRTGWSAVCLVAVTVGVALARGLRSRWPSPGAHVAALLVLGTTLPFVVGPFLGWSGPWPDESLSGGQVVLWTAVGAAGAVGLVLGLLHVDPRAPGRSASMGA